VISSKEELKKGNINKATFLNNLGREAWEIAKTLGLNVLSELCNRQIQ
jgi:hypothetical protein